MKTVKILTLLLFVANIVSAQEKKSMGLSCKAGYGRMEKVLNKLSYQLIEQ
jgi:hypothetical protein